MLNDLEAAGSYSISSGSYFHLPTANCSDQMFIFEKHVQWKIAPRVAIWFTVSFTGTLSHRVKLFHFDFIARWFRD